MAYRRVKTLWMVVFGAFLMLFSSISFGQQNVEDSAAQGAIVDSTLQPANTTVAAQDKAVDINPTELILHHVQDGYEFHFFTLGDFDAAIPLPIVIYSPERGLSVFSYARFGHDGSEEFDGYKLVNGKVAAADGSKIYDFSLTRNVVQLFIVLLIFIFLMFGVTKRYKQGIGVKSGPKGFQNFMEMIIIFIRDNVGKPNLGSRYEKYMPLLLTIFFFILVNALFGLIPGVANVPGNMAFTLMLGIVAWFAIVFSTTGHFWKHMFWPPGVPFLVKIILVPVELVGTLVIKPGALVIRLFANMIAGHIVIASFILLIFLFTQMNKGLGMGFSPVSTLFVIFDYFLEILIAFIQAFIFTALTAIFVGQGFEGSEHDAHPGTHDGMI